MEFIYVNGFFFLASKQPKKSIKFLTCDKFGLFPISSRMFSAETPQQTTIAPKSIAILAMLGQSI